jgi:hypothetical protein
MTMAEPQKTNPANPTAPAKAERKRIPMSIPQRKLEVPELPGYRLYWFLDINVPRALQGGYEHVKDDEIQLNQFSPATDRAISGNADLGTNIRIYGGVDGRGQAEYLNLMKIKEEWFREDQKVLEQRNAQIMSAIFQNEEILGSERDSREDKSLRYVKTALFNRPTRKGK